ncbi:hypothetical protein GCM10010517_37020 [Streptosporangium fragile]|uniref:S1 motif domain-containing protein n=1 Tax=Streptosporangium fragile TaxID=46186 RepID=A0ABN3VZ68_9ACTN
MQPFDDVGANLVPGQVVQVRVTGHESWGVMVMILHHEEIGASVDAAAIDSPSGSTRALLEEYPAVGSELVAVIQQVRRGYPPIWVRLTIRAQDLKCPQGAGR